MGYIDIANNNYNNDNFLCPKDNIPLHSQSITTLKIHDNKSHNSYKNEFIAAAFTKRSGTDKRTNKHMDGQMNKNCPFGTENYCFN
jgi:hypothetical protein